jgi:hypothetical protein
MNKYLLYLVLVVLGFGLAKVTRTPGVQAQGENHVTGRYQLFQGEYKHSYVTLDPDFKTEEVKVLLRIDTFTGAVDELSAMTMPSEEGLQKGMKHTCKWVPLEKEEIIPLK